MINYEKVLILYLGKYGIPLCAIPLKTLTKHVAVLLQYSNKQQRKAGSDYEDVP
jgi:hypothetical protein